MEFLWEMLANAIASGNWIVTVIVGIVVVAYIYFTNKGNHTADIADAISALKIQLDDNASKDAETREALDANSTADAEIKTRVEHLETMVADMYVPITGKNVPTIDD